MGKILREKARDLYYFLKGYPAARFAAPVFNVQNVTDLFRIQRHRGPKRLILPANCCRWGAGFHFSKVCHPFVAAMITECIKPLERFYSNYTPLNTAERYFLNAELNTQIISLPWKSIQMYGKLNENDLVESSHGHQWFGPVSDIKISREFDRCMKTYRSIKNNGYNPEKFGGYPRGYFLANKELNTFCFQVAGGQHRLAALCALGWTSIEVMSMNGNITIYTKEDSYDWPSVKSELISERQACKIFDIHLGGLNTEIQQEMLN